jgi:tRNA A-37 threonylcarbamoyl transferase component Bud32
MAQVEINPAYRDWLEGHDLARADRLLALPGEIICGHPRRQVVQVTLPAFPTTRNPSAGDSITCFLKREHRVSWRQRLANALAGFGFVSASRREAGLLQQLRQAGVGCPDWIAAGEDDNGRAFLLLRGIGGGIDLASFLRRRPSASWAWRREFARLLGESLAHVHEAGFAHHDLYAKHVLVDPHDGTVFFLDWQRSSQQANLDWSWRWHDLAALHATLPDELARRRDRLACLRSYFRATWPGRTPRAVRQQAVRQIERHARRLLLRRKVREQRQTSMPIGSQRLIWLDGEAMCVTPEFYAALGGEMPAWLGTQLTTFPPSGASQVEIDVPGAPRAVLIRRRTSAWFGRLTASLFGRPFVSPELRQLGLLFRLQRHGIATPRLLAFGQQRFSAGCGSFLLTERVAGEPLREWLRQHSGISGDLGRRRHLIRKAAELLKRLHAADCCLGTARLSVQSGAGRLPRLVLAALNGISARKHMTAGTARRDLRSLWQRFADTRLSRTDALRFALAYLGQPRLNPASRKLALFLGKRRAAR